MACTGGREQKIRRYMLASLKKMVKLNDIEVWEAFNINFFNKCHDGKVYKKCSSDMHDELKS